MHYLASDRSTTRPCQLDKNVFLVASFSHALMRGMLFGSQCPADILWDAASGWKACYWPLLNARCNRVLLSRGTGIHKQTCITQNFAFSRIEQVSIYLNHLSVYLLSKSYKVKKARGAIIFHASGITRIIFSPRLST